MKSRNYQICVNCVMDTTDSEIVFDAEGRCDHCATFYSKTLPNWNTGDLGKHRLEKMADSIRSQGADKDFDCIIGMSGGIDSSYLVYIAKEIMGLRPLVFHVDAGWNSQVAVNNIERMVEGLNLDLFTEVINWPEMRDIQLAFFKSGVSHVDAPQDNAFFATMYKFASQHKVKTILTGANLSTECIRNPVEWMYYQSDSRQLKDIHRHHGSISLDTYPFTSILWHKIWLPYFRKVKVLRPLDLIPYKKEEAKVTLQSRFGWQPYPQKHFESRFTKFYESYWLPKRFGFDVRRVQYSSLIVTEQMTRDAAIKLLQEPSYDPTTIDHEFEFVANKLEISRDELRKYLDMPLRTYRDYKSMSKLYGLGGWFLKALGIEIGGKR